MSAPISQAEADAIGAITGAQGGQLGFKLFLNQAAPAPGSPASGIIQPNEAWYKAYEISQFSTSRAVAGDPITGRSPPLMWTLAEHQQATQAPVGWAITSKATGTEIVLAAEKFDRPVQLTPDAPSIVVHPEITFQVNAPPGQTAYLVIDAGMPAAKARHMRRKAFTGVRRGQVVRVVRTLQSLGLWDGREAAKAEQLGIDAVYFVGDENDDAAVQRVIAMAQRSLAATR